MSADDEGGGEAKPTNRHLFVGGLPWEIDEPSLRLYFENCVGKVESAKLARDRDTDEPRGFGWVTMVKAEVAAAAVNQVHWYDGRALNVRLDERKGEGKGKGKSKGKAPPPCVEQLATVRFKAASSVTAALKKFSGKPLDGGQKMFLEKDPYGVDIRKVVVRNLAPTVKVETIEELFADVGTVVFADLRQLSAEDCAAEAAAAKQRQEEVEAWAEEENWEEWDEEGAVEGGAKKKKKRKATEEAAQEKEEAWEEEDWTVEGMEEGEEWPEVEKPKKKKKKKAAEPLWSEDWEDAW